MNTHLFEATCLTAHVICNDAPDPRLALHSKLPAAEEIPDVAVGDTAAVLCVVLIKHGGVWRADLAFEQFYVSAAWIQHLLAVLRSVNLPAYAEQVGKSWYVNGRRVSTRGWTKLPSHCRFNVGGVMRNM